MKPVETLRQAIQEGIEDGIRQIAGTTKPAPKAADVIERHVLSYLREQLLISTTQAQMASQLNPSHFDAQIILRQLGERIGVGK